MSVSRMASKATREIPAPLRSHLTALVLLTVNVVGFAYYWWNVRELTATHRRGNGTSSIFDTCPLIVYNPMDKELLEYYRPDDNPKKVKCWRSFVGKQDCKVYMPITALTDGRVKLSDERSGHECKARCIFLEPGSRDSRTMEAKWMPLPTNATFECDVIETECTKDNTTESFLHTQIYEQNEKPGKDSVATFMPDVYLLILDSVSTFMAKRGLPKTIAYLKDHMGAVQMEFLNKVGINSRPNGFPLMFGKSVEGGSRDLVGLPPLVPDWNDSVMCHKPLDRYHYMISEYSNAGYKTMIAQDWGSGMLYYPNCVGLNRSEADHLWRPFDIRRFKSDTFRKSLPQNSCSESHLQMLEYMEKFMRAYQAKPKIARLWPTTLAHDSMTGIFHTDVQFLDFFQRNRAAIDRSFFFFMGDHGNRRIGHLRLGQYEDRNPFLMVILPAVYRNTSIHVQLEQKVLELMTHFDLHATLIDILKLQPSSNFSDISYRDMSPLSKGSSLFREWRGARNCRTLPIPSQYCLCQYNWTVIRDVEFQAEMGEFLVNELNQQLRNAGLKDKCQKQTYNTTSSLKELVDGEQVIYEVIVHLSPSSGIFSALLRYVDERLVLSSAIDRVNSYGKQGDCVPTHHLRPLCHCVGTTTP